MAKNSGMLKVSISQMLQIAQHCSDRQVKGILSLSRTPEAKGPPLGVVQSSRRQSMSCTYGGSSFSRYASAAERSAESLQVARQGRVEDRRAPATSLAGPLGAAGLGGTLFEVTRVKSQ